MIVREGTPGAAEKVARHWQASTVVLCMTGDGVVRRRGQRIRRHCYGRGVKVQL